MKPKEGILTADSWNDCLPLSSIRTLSHLRRPWTRDLATVIEFNWDPVVTLGPRLSHKRVSELEGCF
jgi:hypothetical protein